MNTDEILDRLIKNAFDFLTSAVRDFEDRPKYSVIHFAAAVELFLKARLMMEHWTLVVAKGKEANVKSFLEGDFQSVNISTAFERLADVVQSPLTKEQKSSFRQIANHRNRVIHFFHDAVDEDSDEELKTAVVKEQCVAWYHLKQLLSQTWEEYFLAYKSDLDGASHSMHLRREFLNVLYEKAKAELDTRKREGDHVINCPVCEFEALVCTPVTENILEGRCLVCSRGTNLLTIECQECGEEVELVGDGNLPCPKCSKRFNPEIIREYLAGDYPMTKDDSIEQRHPHCSLCEHPFSGVRLDDSRVFCSCCFDLADSTYVCEYCNETCTYELDFSYLEGCAQCDGYLASEAYEKQ